MKKKIIAFCVLIVVGILFFNFCSENSLQLHKEVCSTDITVYIDKNESLFLSDEYFCEVNLLFEQIKKENGKLGILNESNKIAAKAVVNKMMDDLENNPNSLENHKNYKRFFETFDKNIRELDSITERMHFFRNTLNSYSGAPANLLDMIDLTARGEWQLFSATFHRFNYGSINGALNIKVLTADGRFEAVYNTETGKIVTDPANIGTYNYAPGSINPVKFYLHNKYDKKPWKKWGNTKGFSYDDIMRLESGHGSDEAKNNSKEVERLIQQRKSQLAN